MSVFILFIYFFLLLFGFFGEAQVHLEQNFKNTGANCQKKKSAFPYQK